MADDDLVTQGSMAFVAMIFILSSLDIMDLAPEGLKKRKANRMHQVRRFLINSAIRWYKVVVLGKALLEA